MDIIKIGKFIAQCRKEKGLTQEGLSEIVGVTNKAVSKWENGSCLPNVFLYEPLCECLGITMNELFAGKHILDDALKYKLYHFSDKTISYSQFCDALNDIFEISSVLKGFESKKDAIDFLVKETNEPYEKCSEAYGFYVEMF